MHNPILAELLIKMAALQLHPAIQLADLAYVIGMLDSVPARIDIIPLFRIMWPNDTGAVPAAITALSVVLDMPASLVTALVPMNASVPKPCVMAPFTYVDTTGVEEASAANDTPLQQQRAQAVGRRLPTKVELRSRGRPVGLVGAAEMRTRVAPAATAAV